MFITMYCYLVADHLRLIAELKSAVTTWCQCGEPDLTEPNLNQFRMIVTGTRGRLLRSRKNR